jgi:Tfp pilus assembly protein PilV
MGAQRLACERGFTLIEIIVASFVLIVGMLGTLVLIDVANSKTSDTKGREAATSLVRELTEDARGIPFTQLTQQSLAASLQSRAGLSSAPGSTYYTIRRRGFTYSVDVSVCSLDDPRNGIASHANGNFCRGDANGYDQTQSCPAAIAAQGGGTDSNGNKFSCGIPDSTLAWSTCTMTGAGQTGSASAEATSAANATTCLSGSATPLDGDPEDYKRVVLQVRWGAHRVAQTTLIANPGSSAGPAVVNLQPTSGLTTVTDAGTTAVGFTATTSVMPASVTWSLNGGTQGDASGSGTTWTFSWPLGPATNPTGTLDPTTVLDGTYLIGARAFDQFGVNGAPRTVTITINRSIPRQPTGLVAGRNNQVVEIDWQPNPEHDITGYHVYRIVPGQSALQVCSTASVSCQDAGAPSASTLNYYVVALDRDPSGSPREGAQSAQVTVTSSNLAPNPPTSLVASTNGGTTILRWAAPNPADADGDSIAFYRIYRDGAAYANRYDRTAGGSDLTYTDTATGGLTHTYYVTAVDGQLAESTLLGPVTR